MPRVPRLTPRFLARRAACGVVRGSPASQALGATIAALCEAETLPGLVDVEVAIPPTSWAYVRRVPGQSLWVWYRIDLRPGEVTLTNLSDVPPVPVL